MRTSFDAFPDKVSTQIPCDALFIALDKMLFSTKKYIYFSYLSTKIVVVSIRSASERHFY